MVTIQNLLENTKQIPSGTAWYLADIGEAKGMQALFEKQSPAILKSLREHALVESTVSSNRIEGVEIENSRIGTIVFGSPHLKDRNEEELKGYREALNEIHINGADTPLSIDTVKRFHKMLSGEIWDAGLFREKESDIIQKYPDGRSRVRFKTVSHKKIDTYMDGLIKLGNDALDEQWSKQLILVLAFNLDFLCIHPFRDGNGRVSRLILLLHCYYLDMSVGRYISLERLIEENKERYYETLEESSIGWHEGKNDPWPYINFILFILKSAYKEFKERYEMSSSPRGSKTELVRESVLAVKGEFSLSDIERLCPGVSRDMIKKIFADMKKEGLIESLGRGPGAAWRKKG